MTDERAAFEAYFADSRRNRGAGHLPSFNTLSDGTYADDHTQRHWWTWQCAILAASASAQGEVTITTNQAGECVAVTRTDDEHRILKVIWERKAASAQPPSGFRPVLVNEGWEPLMSALERAHRKGYMPDAIVEEYEGFDYRDAPPQSTAPINAAAQEPVAGPQESRPQDTREPDSVAPVAAAPQSTAAQPVAHVVEDIDGRNRRVAFYSMNALYDTPLGTKLYAGPPQSTADTVRVPPQPHECPPSLAMRAWTALSEVDYEFDQPKHIVELMYELQQVAQGPHMSADGGKDIPL